MNKEDSDSRAQRFASRFAELTDGATCRELSDKLGISRSTVWAYQKGTRMPKVHALNQIAGVYGVDPLWLMGADVPKFAQPAAAAIPPQGEPNFHLVRVPRMGAIACGQPILAEQNVECCDLVPDWAHCDFTLVCRGDSMIGARIYDGDVVCIHSQPQVENGEIAAVLIDDEATLKRVQIYSDHIVLEPENPNYRPLVYWDRDMENVRILGLATYFISAVR